MKWLLVLLAVIGEPELLAVLAFVFFAWDWRQSRNLVEFLRPLT